MIVLFTRCRREDELLVDFDSGEAELPFSDSGATPSVPGALYPCMQPDTWAFQKQFWSEVDSWEIDYRPPATLKAGIWEITIETRKGSFAGLPETPPVPLYNQYITVCAAACGSSGLFLPLCPSGSIADFIDESEAGDGSDPIEEDSQTVELGFLDPGAAPCCFGGWTIIRCIAGPTNEDDTPRQYWSWFIRITGTWLSDFPP